MSHKSTDPSNRSARPNAGSQKTLTSTQIGQSDAWKAIVRDALQTNAQDLFVAAWGEPARRGAKQWRARQSSAYTMVMSGGKRGLWKDFKSGEGGDLFDFVAVYLCKLTRANEDFPRVLDVAAQFCGLTKGQDYNLDEIKKKTAAREAQGKKDEAKERARKAELVKAVQARAEPLTGTPAEVYLKSRGIEKLPEGWSYLPPVPDLKVQKRNYHALVVWALDANGQTTGGQRVLLEADGRRVNFKPNKVTFGVIKGSPARIAASVENGPLLIAEGPETAAAIAQCTGYEVWGVPGANFFKSVPAPRDRQVILCPDRDAPNSDADTNFQNACKKLHAEGINLWIAPAPEPEGSKHDLLDTLEKSGEAAVRAAIAAATPYVPPRDAKGRFTGAGAFRADPLPMPSFLNKETARQRIRQLVLEFLEKAAIWHAARKTWDEYCKVNGDHLVPPELAAEAELASTPPPVLALAASPGAGKSRITREVLAEFNLNEFYGGDVLFVTPTLKLAEEAAGHAEELGAGWHVTRGRGAVQPGTTVPMCRRSEEASRVVRAGLRVFPTLCSRMDGEYELQCPYFSECPHVHQWDELEAETTLRFESSAYLPLSGDGSGRKTALNIVDESIWRIFIRKFDMPFDVWLKPRNVAPHHNGKRKTTPAQRNQADALAADMLVAAQDVLKTLQEGQDLSGLNYTAEDFRTYAMMERGPEILTVPPCATDQEIRSALDELEANDISAGKRAQFWSILADCLANNLNYTERLRIVRDVPAPNSGEKRDVLRATWFAQPTQDVPTLLLDADAAPEIVHKMYSNAELQRVELRPNATVVQASDKTFSTRALQNSKLRNEVIQLVRAEVLADKVQGDRGVLTVATKKVVRQFFEDAGFTFEGMTEAEISQHMLNTELHGAKWLWFGPAALGLNTWQNCGTAIVVGREEIPVEVLEDQLRAVAGDTGLGLQFVLDDGAGNKLMPEEPVSYLMKDGSGFAVKTRVHPDPFGRILQQQARELATRQSYERLRLANAAQAKRIVLACKVPIPGLPVDELITWDELRPARLEAAQAEAAQNGGILRLSAAGLANDAPTTFPSVNAAKQWLKSQGQKEVMGVAPLIRYNISGTTPITPRAALLRLQGQRGPSPTPSLIVLPGDAKKMAEAQLGPLSMFVECSDHQTTSLKTPDISTDQATAPVEAVVLNQGEIAFARAHKQAKVTEANRAELQNVVRFRTNSAVAKVAKAIAKGVTKAKEIVAETNLTPEKTGTALRKMKDAGLVFEWRPGRFSLTFDLADLERAEVSGGNRVEVVLSKAQD